MDCAKVLLIGVFDPDGQTEGFTYTVNAPTNLWIGAVCDDGSRMSHEFMAYFLNSLLEADAFDEGDFVITRNQDRVQLTAIVGPLVAARSVDAFQAQTDEVRKVSVHVGE
jgi:hypothetical protein